MGWQDSYFVVLYPKVVANTESVQIGHPRGGREEEKMPHYRITTISSHSLPGTLSKLHWFCRAAELSQDSPTNNFNHISQPTSLSSQRPQLSLVWNSRPCSVLLNINNLHYFIPRLHCQITLVMLRAALSKPQSGLLGRACRCSRSISTGQGARLVRGRPDVALASGRNSMAVVAQACRRSYAMAAEDTNKGVVRQRLPSRR